MISRDPDKLYAPLKLRWFWLKQWWETHHQDAWTAEIRLFTTFRSHEAQKQEFEAGRSRAEPGQSLHNFEPAYAFDFFFQDTESGTAIWDDWRMYELVGEMGRDALSLEWGGDWTGLKDGVHLQMPMDWRDAEAGRVPTLPALPVWPDDVAPEAGSKHKLDTLVLHFDKELYDRVVSGSLTQWLADDGVGRNMMARITLRGEFVMNHRGNKLDVRAES